MTISRRLCACLVIAAGMCLSAPAGADFTFVQISDIHVTGAAARYPSLGLKPQSWVDSGEGAKWSANREALIQQINQRRPDFVIITGDLAETGANFEYQALLTWVQKFNAPVYLVAGNHDTGRRASPDPAARKKPGRERSLLNYERLFGRSFYSFPVQNAYFILMNSSLFSADNRHDPYQQARDMEVQRWLDSELRYANNASYPLVFVLQHYPLRETPGLAEVLQHADVSALMFGHTHHFFSGKSGNVITVSVSSSKGGATPTARPCFALVKVNSAGATYRYIGTDGKPVRPAVHIPARDAGANSLWDVRARLYPQLPPPSLDRMLSQPVGSYPQ